MWDTKYRWNTDTGSLVLVVRCSGKKSSKIRKTALSKVKIYFENSTRKTIEKYEKLYDYEIFVSAETEKNATAPPGFPLDFRRTRPDGSSRVIKTARREYDEKKISARFFNDRDDTSARNRDFLTTGTISLLLRVIIHNNLTIDCVFFSPSPADEQMSNDDGDWVLLNSESVERHCQQSVPYIEAWCMRVNKYLNNEQFLVPANGGDGHEPNGYAPQQNEKHAAIAPKPSRET